MNIRSIIAAIRKYVSSPPPPTRPATVPPAGSFTHGMASSFADPADVRAFNKCRREGGYFSRGVWYPCRTEEQCFACGDNGIGKWGDSTIDPTPQNSADDVPMCALPYEDWKPFGIDARGKKVIVRANGHTVICELRDTLPHKKNIKHGVVIDLNEDAAEALHLKPPFLVHASWAWA